MGLCTIIEQVKYLHNARVYEEERGIFGAFFEIV
jgi:hypothetical protein